MFPSPNVINNRNLIWWASHRIPSSYYTSRTKYDYKIGYLTSYCPLKKETGPASETRRFENTTRTTIIVQTSHRPRERPSGSWHLIQLLGSRQNATGYSSKWEAIRFIGKKTRWMDVGQCHDCNRETKTTQCDCSSHLWGWVQCETVYSAGLGTGKTGPCRRQKL